MSDRVEYIRRRLDQLEAAAKAAGWDCPEWSYDRNTFTVSCAEYPIASHKHGVSLNDVDGEHIALWDPAAVLARVAADRKLLAEHKAWDFNEDGREVCGRCMEHRRRGKGWKFMPAPCPTIRLMAEGLGWTGGSSE